MFKRRGTDDLAFGEPLTVGCLVEAKVPSDLVVVRTRRSAERLQAGGGSDGMEGWKEAAGMTVDLSAFIEEHTTSGGIVAMSE